MSDPWYRSEVAQILCGVRSASGSLSDERRAGFDAAITSTALSFGVDPNVIMELTRHVERANQTIIQPRRQ